MKVLNKAEFIPGKIQKNNFLIEKNSWYFLIWSLDTKKMASRVVYFNLDLVYNENKT